MKKIDIKVPEGWYIYTSTDKEIVLKKKYNPIWKELSLIDGWCLDDENEVVWVENAVTTSVNEDIFTPLEIADSIRSLCKLSILVSKYNKVYGFDEDDSKYHSVDPEGKIFCWNYTYNPNNPVLRFGSKAAAEAFISRPENVELIKKVRSIL